MKRMAAGFLSLALLLAGGQAKADLFTGYVIQNDVTDGTSAPTTLPGPADAQFTTSSIFYSSYGNPVNGYNGGQNDYTLGTFLGTNNNNTALTNADFTNQSTNFSTNAPYAAGPSNGNLAGNYGSAGTLDNTYILITGTIHVNTGDVLSIVHDDGTNLVVNGVTLITAPGKTAQETSTAAAFAGPSGNYSFSLGYGEVAGPPAILQFYDNGILVTPISPTPEPATITMAGLGLVALGGVKLIRRRKRVAA